MKPYTSYRLLLFILLHFAGYSNGKTNSNEALNKSLGPALAFTENKGQIHDQYYQPRADVLFAGVVSNVTYHFRNNGISYQLYHVDSWKSINTGRGSGPYSNEVKIEDQLTIYRLDINWLGTNKEVSVRTENEHKSHNNYYSEVCPKGITGVKTYDGIYYQNLYNHIDLHYYRKDNQLKYDYIVSPGGNYKRIQLQVNGAEKIRILPNGTLQIKTPLGNIEEGKPIVYQEGKELKAKWRLDNNILSFEIEGYNPTRKLIIDPVIRIWGTYYGGSGGSDNSGTSVCDAQGNVYLAGFSGAIGGTGNMATTGAHQLTSAGNGDVIVAKFNAMGLLEWGTYYGGSNYETGLGCARDAAGNVYVSGTTWSTGTVMATPGSYQPAHGGAVNDCFLAKFNNMGVLQWGTYYGGTGNDISGSCATDMSGNVYMACYTESANSSLTTSSAHQTTSGGLNDAVLVKFNSSGSRLWATYYGGSGEDYGANCTTDATGNVFLAGTSNSTNSAIATITGHQSSNGGGYDAFLVKFNSSGQLQWGTFYGGSAGDNGTTCGTDVNGNAYLAGYTASTGTSIATAAAHQTINAGTHDAFLVKFDGNGVRQWGTYYGGTANEIARHCITDGSGNVYLTGESNSTGSLLATSAGHQTAYIGPNTWSRNIFLTQFNSAGLRLWGTYYGNSDEIGGCCSIDGAGNMYLTGTTYGALTQISTPLVYQPVYGGGSADIFLVKFGDCTLPDVPISNTAPNQQFICSQSSTSLTVIQGTASISWYTTPVSLNPVGTGSLLVTPTLSVGTYTYYAEAYSCARSASRTAVTITVNALPVISVNSGSICSGKVFTISATGAATYSYSGGSHTVSPQVSTSYSVTGISAAGCISQSVVVSHVTVIPNPSVTVNSGVICQGETFTITPSGAATYTIQGGNALVTPASTSNYTVAGTSTAGCLSSNTAMASVTVNPLPSITVLSSNTLICEGETTTLTASGASSYTFNPGGTVTSITISPNTTSIYTITGSDANGCINKASITQSVDACLGIRNEKLKIINEALVLYPNPTSGIIYLESRFDGEIMILNALGQQVYSAKLSAGQQQLNLEYLAKGVYVLKATSAGSTKSIRVLME